MRIFLFRVSMKKGHVFAALLFLLSNVRIIVNFCINSYVVIDKHTLICMILPKTEITNPLNPCVSASPVIVMSEIVIVDGFRQHSLFSSSHH